VIENAPRLLFIIAEQKERKMLSDAEKISRSIDGEVHLFNGEYDLAFECFVESGSKRNLIRLARAALEKGLTHIAEESFRLAGATPSYRECEIIKGDLSFGSGDLMKAHRCYENAGARIRLLGLGLHCLKNGYVLIALNCYEKAGVKPPEDELRNFIDKYVENIEQRIRKRSHIGVKEACYALHDKEKLKSIAKLLIEKGQILLGIYFWEDTGEKFPSESLTRIQKAKLIAEGDRHYRDSVRFDHCLYGSCIEAYAKAGAKDRLLGLFDQCLEEDELEHALKILNVLYGAPLKYFAPREMEEKIFEYAKAQLRKGEFREGMKACSAIGRKPPKTELYACGEKCLFGSDERELFMLAPEVFREGMKAYRKAGLTPSRKKIVAAGYRYLELGLGFSYYARQAFEEARSVEHLRYLIGFFEKQNEELLKEKEDPKERENWASEMNKKDVDEEIKKGLIEIRDSSFDSSMRFNRDQICEIQEAIKRLESMN